VVPLTVGRFARPHERMDDLLRRIFGSWKERGNRHTQ